MWNFQFLPLFLFFFFSSSLWDVATFITCDMPAMDLRILAKMTGQFRETIFILAILPCGADNVHNEVQGSVLVDCRAWNGMVHISRSFRDSLTALHVGRVGEINGYYYEQYYDNGMLVPCVQSLCHRVNVWRNAWLVVCREDQDSGWWWWGEAVGRSVFGYPIWHRWVESCRLLPHGGSDLEYPVFRT